MRNIIIIVTAALGLLAIGCGGTGFVEVQNHTSSYVHGDVDGSKFGLESGGSWTLDVEVGGFMSYTSDVSVNSYVHETRDMRSRIIDELHSEIEVKADETRTYAIMSHSGGRAYELRLIRIENKGNITGS